jgi:Skp family chaperone for outer membrane proteins
MKLHRLLFAVALLGAMGGAIARAEDPAAPRVGVINYAKVFYSLDETKAFDDQIRADRNAINLEGDTRSADLKTARDELNSFKQDSDQYAKKHDQLEAKIIEDQVWLATKKAEMDRKQKVEFAQLFGRVRDSVAAVAKSHHMDVVISAIMPDMPDDLDAISFDDLRARIQQANVMYVGDNVDITDEVVAALNAAYKAATNH